MGKIVEFHTKIHLDLTEALAKRLGQKPTDEAVEEERRKNKQDGPIMPLDIDKKFRESFDRFKDNEDADGAREKHYAEIEVIKEEWRQRKMDKADEDWARDHPEEDEIEYPPKKKNLESEWHDSNIGKANGK